MSTYNGTLLIKDDLMAIKKFPAYFYCSESGNEPVRDWLLSLKDSDKKVIGEDLKKVEFAWPIGMPICRSISSYKGLWEVRSNLSGAQIARILFTETSGKMILLHGFIKKTNKTPKQDLELASKRMKEVKLNAK